MSELGENVYIREGLIYTKSDQLFTGKLGGKTIAKVVNGKIEGKYLEYYDNGQVRYDIFYKNNKEEGRYLEYYSNGNLKFKGIYKDGKQEGSGIFILIKVN